MNWLSLLGSPLTALFSGIGGYFKDRQAIKATQTKMDGELALAKHNERVARITAGNVTEANYDSIAQDISRHSIVDELMIFWLLCLVTLMFIPPLQPFVITGFTALSASTPAWFQLCFVGAFISKLGLRFLFSGRALFGDTK